MEWRGGMLPEPPIDRGTLGDGFCRTSHQLFRGREEKTHHRPHRDHREKYLCSANSVASVVSRCEHGRPTIIPSERSPHDKAT